MLTAVGAINVAQPLTVAQGNGDQPVAIVATPQPEMQLPPYIK
jgi:hypothetical protein